MDSKLMKPPETETQAPSSGEGAMMSFFDHLDELRVRLFRAILSVGIGMAVSVFFTDPVLQLIRDSYGGPLQVIDPTDNVVIFFRVTLFLGAILASPMITYQLFMFILPGLTGKEKRWVLLALPATTALFLVGVGFTGKFLVPAYISFLKGFESHVFRVDWKADSYIGFITSVLFWHAAAFETPLVFFVLGRFGVVNARQMLKYWRHAVVVASIISAFITPTIDPLTMVVITFILMGLYLMSVILVALTSGLGKQRKAA
jgi:sec-independent protein translocase protein TatC